MRIYSVKSAFIYLWLKLLDGLGRFFGTHQLSVRLNFDVDVKILLNVDVDGTNVKTASVVLLDAARDAFSVCPPFRLGSGKYGSVRGRRVSHSSRARYRHTMDLGLSWLAARTSQIYVPIIAMFVSPAIQTFEIVEVGTGLFPKSLLNGSPVPFRIRID